MQFMFLHIFYFFLKLHKLHKNCIIDVAHAIFIFSNQYKSHTPSKFLSRLFEKSRKNFSLSTRRRRHIFQKEMTMSFFLEEYTIIFSAIIVKHCTTSPRYASRLTIKKVTALIKNCK